MKFENVEKSHQIYKSKVKKGIWVAFGIAAVLFIILFSTSIKDGFSIMSIFGFFFIMIFIVSIAAIIIMFATRNQAKAYRNAYKSYFVEKNLHKTFTNLKYSHEMGLAREALSSTQMINTGDVYKSNDLTTGKYKDVAFTQADVHIQEEHTDSDGNTTYVTIFKGRFMIYEFPKKFNFRLEVAENGFGANRIPGKNRETGRKFEKITLESSEFNKMFKTYAEDGFEAFYLLDPAFINNILELGQEYKGKIFLGFIENKLVVGLKDGKDAFEPPSVFKKLDEATEDAKIAKDIHLVTNFIDKLKLDQKIFK